MPQRMRVAGSAGTSTRDHSQALKSGLEKVERMINWGRLRFPTASENLRHWRDGKGRDRVLPTRVFQSERFLLDHLRDEHRPRFINGTKRRLTSGELAPGHDSVDMEWTDSVNAPFLTDLYFAL